jgi:hypothetical protein
VCRNGTSVLELHTVQHEMVIEPATMSGIVIFSLALHLIIVTAQPTCNLGELQDPGTCRYPMHLRKKQQSVRCSIGGTQSW